MRGKISASALALTYAQQHGISDQQIEAAKADLDRLIGIHKGSKVNIIEADITPAMAAALIIHYNRGNRSLSLPNLRKIASDISSGRWVPNSDRLGFNTDGILGNGQHRLLGALHANKAVQMDIRFGLSPNAFETEDSGKKRTAGDTVKIGGVSQYSTQAATLVRAVLVWWSTGSLNPSADRTISNAAINEAFAFANEDDGSNIFLDAAKAGVKHRSKFPSVTESMIAFSYWHLLFVGKDADSVASYFDNVFDAKRVNGQQDPVYIVRTHLQRLHARKVQEKTKEMRDEFKARGEAPPEKAPAPIVAISSMFPDVVEYLIAGYEASESNRRITDVLKRKTTLLQVSRPAGTTADSLF